MMVGAAADADDALVDLLADGALLLHCSGDLAAHLADFVDPAVDVMQGMLGIAGMADAVLRLFAAALHHLYRILCAGLQRGDHFLDVGGGGRRA